jgi:hypothetical protein
VAPTGHHLPSRGTSVEGHSSRETVSVFVTPGAWRRVFRGMRVVMMDGSTLLVIAMVAMMVLMCGGMLFGSGWALFRRRGRNRRHDREHPTPGGQ